MSNLLNSFKTAFPDKAIILVQGEEELPVNTIGVVFADNKDCEDIELVKRSIRAQENIINTKSEDYIAVSKSTPIRIKHIRAGERLPRNHYPIASWNGEQLRVSLPVDSKDLLIEDILVSSLPMLIGEETDKKDYLALCKGLSLGISSEKEILEKQEKNNRVEGQKLLMRAEEYLQAADKDARIIANLEKMEKEETAKHAKEQWEDIVAMIPQALQRAWIENGKICVLTTPITLLGQFMGAYKIQVNISSGKINISGATPGVNTKGNPHPHVRLSHDNSENVCWGTLNNIYTELRASKNYVHLIQAALRLLNQYNKDSEFTNLLNWGNRYSGNTTETTLSDCRARGPEHSLGQARKCLSCPSETRCSFKENNKKKIYEACYALSAAKDCVSCEYKDCPHYEDRFDRCWSIHAKTGPAFCMLRCAREECTHREEALKSCTKSNRRADGTCPASDKCWKPCINTGDKDDK